VDGERHLPKDQVANADPNYLAKEIRERPAREPVRFELLLEIAELGDKLDDPSTAWPQTRKNVELGLIEVIEAVADNAAAERQVLFIPGSDSEVKLQQPTRTSAYRLRADSTRNHPGSWLTTRAKEAQSGRRQKR
jgi:hypothetical protein